jgi:2-alkyl-3-oxoalkanoate reductase
MRVVVFGATGVVGRRAVPLMIREGHRVTAVGRSPERLQNLASQGAFTIALDLFDRDAIKRAVVDHEAIVNLATAIPRSTLAMFFPSAWKENDRIREHVSASIVDEALAAGVRAYIQESFAPIYVDAGDRWISNAKLRQMGGWAPQYATSRGGWAAVYRSSRFDRRDH